MSGYVRMRRKASPTKGKSNEEALVPLEDVHLDDYEDVTAANAGGVFRERAEAFRQKSISKTPFSSTQKQVDFLGVT